MGNQGSIFLLYIAAKKSEVYKRERRMIRIYKRLVDLSLFVPLGSVKFSYG